MPERVYRTHARRPADRRGSGQPDGISAARRGSLCVIPLARGARSGNLGGRTRGQHDPIVGDAGQIKQIVEQMRHVADLVGDRPFGLAADLGVAAAGSQQFDRGADGSEGIAQFVGQSRQKAILGLVGFAGYRRFRS